MGGFGVVVWGIARDKKRKDHNLGKSSDSKFWYSSKLMVTMCPCWQRVFCGVWGVVYHGRIRISETEGGILAS